MTETLYLDGKPLIRGEFPLCTLSEDESEYQGDGLSLSQEISGSISFETNITARQMLFLMTGKLPSNNWLKMHGGVMERKARRKRRWN
jgi:hypothetical protein